MKRRRFAYCAILCVCALCNVSAVDYTWITAAGGEWSDSSNWSPSSEPGSADKAVFSNLLMTNQVVDLGQGGSAVNVLHTPSTTAPWSRVFSGDLAIGRLANDSGSVKIKGNWTFNGRHFNRIGHTANQNASVELLPGSILTMEQGTSLDIGGEKNDGTSSAPYYGQLFINPGVSLIIDEPASTASGMYIGRAYNSVGAVVQRGGTVAMNTAFIPGYRGYGCYEMFGGTFTHPHGNSQTRYRLGMNGPGLFYLHGGTYSAGRGSWETYDLAKNTSAGIAAKALFFVDGGLADLYTSVHILQANSGASGGSFAEMTVTGGGVIDVPSSRSLTLGSSDISAGGRAALNINNGGTLRLTNLKIGSNDNTALNFDGGTLALNNTADKTIFNENANLNMIVYGSGAYFEPTRYGRIAFNQIGGVRLAQGSGITNISVNAGGSGYIAPPLVEFSGGGGINASAVAMIDYAQGSVTGVIITCKGENYTSAPAVAFTGGGGSAAAASSFIAPHSEGDICFGGNADSIIYKFHEYAGAVRIKEKKLIISSRGDAANPGMDSISELRLSGGAVQLGSAGNDDDCLLDNTVNPLARLVFSGVNGGGRYAQAYGPSNNVHRQEFAAMDILTGQSFIDAVRPADTVHRKAELELNELTRKPGGLLFVENNIFDYQTIKSGTANLHGLETTNSIMAGIFHSYSDFITLNTNGAWRVFTNYDASFGAGKNWYVEDSSPSNSVSGLAVNSIRLPQNADLQLDAAGTTVVESGMIKTGNGSDTAVIRGGALTSGNGKDLIIYDAHNSTQRRNTSSDNVTLQIDSKISDNGSTPVALVLTGKKDMSEGMLSTGNAIVLSSADNDYSGGTYLINALVDLESDSALGALPAAPEENIYSSDMSLIRVKNGEHPLELNANRGIVLRGGALALIGDDNNQVGAELIRINGSIIGDGVLVCNHWAGDAVASIITLNGDNSSMKGTVAVHGVLRAQDGRSLSPLANLALCDIDGYYREHTKSMGVLETSGCFARAPGTGAGQVQWTKVNSVYPNLVFYNDNAYCGGFSAYGAELSVNLGGDGRVLTMGADGFKPGRIQLQTDWASDDLAWVNPIELDGDPFLQIRVGYNSSSTVKAYWKGAFSNTHTNASVVNIVGRGEFIFSDGADSATNITLELSGKIATDISGTQTIESDVNLRGSFTKRGTGITYFNGMCTNDASVSVTAGSLLINSNHLEAGSYAVSSAAALGGDGVIVPESGASITVEGSLAPGADLATCGNLTVGSAVAPTTLTLNGTLELDVDLATNDLLTLNGDLVIDSGTSIDVTALDESVWKTRRDEVITVLSWSGSVSGADLAAINVNGLPRGWSLKVNPPAQEARLAYAAPGTVIILR